MKILVLSDSHAAMRFMRSCVDAIKPQAIVHLGDYYDDAQTLGALYPYIALHHVPGNCDRYRCPPWVQPTLCYDAQAALYGHTHVAECRRTEDGMYILNPGSAGYGGGSAGLIEAENGRILSCRILRQEDLEMLT